MKIMYLARRNPVFPSQEAFQPRWRQHGKLAMSLPTWQQVRRYVHSDALPGQAHDYDGVGTMVIDEKLESLREATADDIGGILQLIEPFERAGTLVKRSRTEIERDVALYTVIEHDGVIFGCAALYPYPDERTAEMAALTPTAYQSSSAGKNAARYRPKIPVSGLSAAQGCRSAGRSLDE